MVLRLLFLHYWVLLFHHACPRRLHWDPEAVFGSRSDGFLSIQVFHAHKVFKRDESQNNANLLLVDLIEELVEKIGGESW